MGAGTSAAPSPKPAVNSISIPFTALSGCGQLPLLRTIRGGVPSTSTT